MEVINHIRTANETLDELRREERELEEKLRICRKKIHDHDDVIKARINQGVSEFFDLVGCCKHQRKYFKSIEKAKEILTESIVDYEQTYVEDENDVKPGKHIVHEYMLEDNWVIRIGIYLLPGHEQIETSATLINGVKALSISTYGDDLIDAIKERFKREPRMLYYLTLFTVIAKILDGHIADSI